MTGITIDKNFMIHVYSYIDKDTLENKTIKK